MTETEALAVLRDLAARAQPGPFAALGISDDADAAEIRRAFLQLIHRTHPSKYARFSADTVRFANEVFLQIKRAHDTLVQREGRGKTAAAALPIVDPAAAPRAVPAAAPKAAAPVAVRISATAARAKTDPQAIVSVHAGIAGVHDTARTAIPAGAAALHNTARTSVPQAGTEASRARIAALRDSARTPIATTHDTARTAVPAGPSATVAQATSVARPDVQSGGSRVGTPVATSVAVPPAGAGAARPSSAPDATTSSEPAVVNAKRSLSELRTAAMEAIDAEEWTKAKETFLEMAALSPREKEIRALLCFARGKELEAKGQANEAQAEFERALALDPKLQLAQKAAQRKFSLKSLFGR